MSADETGAAAAAGEVQPLPKARTRRTAKKATGKTIRVRLVGGDVDGKVRVFPAEKAERLIRLGHARR